MLTGIKSFFIWLSAINSNKVEVTLSGDVGELTAKDFNIVGDGLSVVKVDQEGKTATIELNKDMTDGAEYTLQLIDEEENVLSEASFKYELGEVASIALTKASFEIGEKVTDFLKVLDKNGVEISSADYNLLELQTSNTDVVKKDDYGTIENEGTANVRFKIEYKDGSIAWSDFITVNVEEAVTAELAGFHLNSNNVPGEDPDQDDNGESYPAFDNTVDYTMKAALAKTTLYESDVDQYLEVYADDSKGNPEINHLDLAKDSDYEVKSLDTNIATITQDEEGTVLNYVAPGKARILITGKDNYKKTITVNVSKDPYYKDIVLGATEVKLSDEVLEGYSDFTSAEEDVTETTVALKWKDQNDDLKPFNLSTATTNDEKNQIVLEDPIAGGDKLVISTSNSNGAFEISTTDDGELKVEAKDGKETKDASIRVSYYADKTDNNPTRQKKIATTVTDIDASKSAVNYQTLVDKSAIDPNGLNHTATVTAFAVDKDGNRVGNVTEKVELTANESVSVSEQEWFKFGEPANNQVTFADNAKYYMTESGAIKVNYTVADGNPHGTVTLSYENSFAAPDKAVVNTKPVVADLSTEIAWNDSVTAQSLLFGKILANSQDLVIDTDDNSPAGESPSIDRLY